MIPISVLKQLRKERKISQSALAQHMNVTQATVSGWESGKYEIDNSKLVRLANFFDVSVDYLLGNSEGQRGVMIPILGRVSAGLPTEAVEDVLGYEELGARAARAGEFFALQIRGDSMEPKFTEGDVVIVRRQPDVDSGDIAVALIGDEDTTIKRVKKDKSGIMLIPSNPKYEPRFFTNEEIQTLPVTVLGKVVELRAKF